ncbi:MAG: DUF4450 domain-containing protein [Niabella sp.]
MHRKQFIQKSSLLSAGLFSHRGNNAQLEDAFVWCRKNRFHIIILFILSAINCFSLKTAAQEATTGLWHNQERTLHYSPSGKDFVLYQGTKKFNRALYGSNTGFRVETGDLPEFAMYMPGMGGNCKIGIVSNRQSKWITEAGSIQTIYRPGSMLYTIKDALLQNGELSVTVLPMAAADGMIIKLTTKNIPAGVSVLIVYGGATGKKFSRDGDIGADPESSFYLQPGYCKDNDYTISQHQFQLRYGFTQPLSEAGRSGTRNGKAPDSTKKDKAKIISGIFPLKAAIRIVDAAHQETPVQLWESAKSGTPAIAASVTIRQNETIYFIVQKDNSVYSYNNAPALFASAEQARAKIANRIILDTPDPYINPLAGALAIAADAIWEAPSYLHGAVAWRMRLPAWRGAYAADALGWHDRARMHFDSYLKSQVTHIPAGPVTPDTALHFARQLEKLGTAMFSNGYICRNPDGDIRPHHYDMNLVFIDQLLTHFNYTGDIAYIKKVWPNIKLHLQWEKRNFDADDDGLYDAYACIWASDALYYNGGGVAYSSAYNYRANRAAEKIAGMLGEDAHPYKTEADKILAAMNNNLWLKNKGWFAENKDLTGLQLTHTAPGLWTIYHAIDEGAATTQQQFQLLRYVDNYIPHIPVKAKGLDIDNLYLLSTTNWQPYTWSVNNVALAENLHTALAYWQSGEDDNAFRLWKSSLIESMYLSSSPGGFEQLSFYDAARGELYRDFADPIGVAARTLTEGLFGIYPNATENQLLIRPGFPAHWKFAKMATPDIAIDFKENKNTTTYHITQQYSRLLSLILQVSAPNNKVQAVLINGKKANYTWIKTSINYPAIVIDAGKQPSYNITIQWAGDTIEAIPSVVAVSKSGNYDLSFRKAVPVKVFNVLPYLKASVKAQQLHIQPIQTGVHTVFTEMQQGEARWLAATNVTVNPDVEIKYTEDKNQLTIINYSGIKRSGTLLINNYSQRIQLDAGASKDIQLSINHLTKGTNTLLIKWDSGTIDQQNIINWNAAANGNAYEPVDLTKYFNEKVTNTFNRQYLSPRPAATTLQLPWQGIGNWCYPLVRPEIEAAGIKNKQTLYLDKIPFKINAGKNIAYTAQWSNFPQSINIPLTGKSGHAWLLMAGTTNHQQSQIPNGIIYIEYKDGSTDSLLLINPENWWPIEQDYLNDGYAFKAGIKPYRLIFKTGALTRDYNHYNSIKGFTDRAIDGGAGTLLDIPLNSNKELKGLTVKTLANEVLVGLMSLTLERN